MPDPNHGAESVTERRAARGAGGTPGGIGSFFVGLGMMLVGGYMILNQVVVHSHFSIWGLPGASGGLRRLRLDRAIIPILSLRQVRLVGHRL